MEQFNSIVNKNLSWIHENKNILPVVALFLGMYVALIRPTLPQWIERLFTNPVFRLLLLSYVIYRGNKDPQLSLMIAAAFLITMHMINKQQVEKLGINGTGLSGLSCPEGWEPVPGTDQCKPPGRQSSLNSSLNSSLSCPEGWEPVPGTDQCKPPGRQSSLNSSLSCPEGWSPVPGTDQCQPGRQSSLNSLSECPSGWEPIPGTDQCRPM